MASRMKLYKLVVLGDGGVGKTALTIQLCLNHFVETYDPTIEDSYRKQVVIDQQSCMLEVLDTAGQEEYTALRDQWIRDGEGFVLVYSITSRSSFSRIQRFHNQIQRVKESAGSPISIQSPIYPSPSGSVGPVPVMLVGNKCDKGTEREVSAQEGRELARELNCEWVEASAKSCVNVEKAFYDVAFLVVGRTWDQIQTTPDITEIQIGDVTAVDASSYDTLAALFGVFRRTGVAIWDDHLKSLKLMHHIAVGYEIFDEGKNRSHHSQPRAVHRAIIFANAYHTTGKSGENLTVD